MNTIGGFIHKGDISLFYWINRNHQCAQLNKIMKYITHLGSTVFSTFLALALLLIPSTKTIGIQLVLVLILSQIIVQSMKRIVNRPRPFITLSNTISIAPPTCKYSFPSGHTCAAFSIALVISQAIPSLSLILISLALLVAISRVYLGVHYPTDIIIGMMVAYVTVKITMIFGSLSISF